MTTFAVRSESDLEEPERHKTMPTTMIEYFPESQRLALLQLFYTAWKLAEQDPERKGKGKEKNLGNLRTLFECGRVAEVIEILEADHVDYKGERQLRVDVNKYRVTKTDLIRSLRLIPRRYCEKIRNATKH